MRNVYKTRESIEKVEQVVSVLWLTKVFEHAMNVLRNNRMNFNITPRYNYYDQTADIDVNSYLYEYY